MHSHSFGNYLLENNYINAATLVHALNEAKSITLSLPVIAIYSSRITSREVEYLMDQVPEHGSFEAASLHFNYFTEEDIAEMQSGSYPDFLLIAQILLDRELLNYTQFEEALVDYQSSSEIYEAEADLDFTEKSDAVIAQIISLMAPPDPKYFELYFKLLFNHLVKYIGSDFTVLDPFLCPEYPTNLMIAQTIEASDFRYVSAIDIDMNFASEFAARYAQESFTNKLEYVQASIEDFLNLHNGVFNVNLSNIYSKEVMLMPPLTYHNEIFSIKGDTCLLPILFPFGTIMILFATTPM